MIAGRESGEDASDSNAAYQAQTANQQQNGAANGDVAKAPAATAASTLQLSKEDEDLFLVGSSDDSEDDDELIALGAHIEDAKLST